MYPRILIQVALPYTEREELVWRHDNSRASIRIETGYREDESGADVPCGIPHGGVGRLIFNRITTIALKQGSPVIELGSTMTEWLTSMDIHVSGGRNGRIRYVGDMLERVIKAKVTFITADATGPGCFRKEEQVRIAGEYCLWGGQSPAGVTDGQLTLSPEFYEELVRSAVPVDERVLSYFKRSPLTMDLYTWLTYRANSVWRTGKPMCVSWKQLYDQFPTEHKNRHAFARSVREHLRKIQGVWRDLKIETLRGRMVLHPCKPHVPSR